MKLPKRFILIIVFYHCWEPKSCLRVCVSEFISSEIKGKALVRGVSEQMEGGWKANRK